MAGYSSLFCQVHTLSADFQKFGPQEGLHISRFTGIFADSTDVLWVLGQNKKLLSENGQFVVSKYDGERFNQYPPLDLKADRLFGALQYQETNILLNESTQSKIFIYHTKSNVVKDTRFDITDITVIYSIHVEGEKIYCFAVKKNGKHAVYLYQKSKWSELFESEHLQNTMWTHHDDQGFWILKADSILFITKSGEINRKFTQNVGSSYTCTKTDRGMEIFPIHGKNPYIIDPYTGERKPNHIFRGVKNYPYIIQKDKKGNTFYLFDNNHIEYRAFVVSPDGTRFELLGLEQELSDVKNVVGDDFLKSFWIVKTFDLMKVEVKPKFTEAYLLNIEHRKIQRIKQKIYLSTESFGLFASDYGPTLNFVKIEENNNQRLFDITKDGYTFSNDGATLLKKKGKNIQKIQLEVFPLDVVWLNDEKLLVAGDHKIYLVDKNLWKAEELSQIKVGFVQKLLPLNASMALVGGNNGLMEVDVVKKTLRNIFKQETVLCITPYGENCWFFGTTSGSLYQYTKANGKDSIKKLITLSAEIATITEDGDQRFWLATFDGLYIFDPAKNDLFKIDDKVLTHKECNRLSSYYDAKYNRMFIGTIHGLNVFDINKMDLKKTKLKVSLSYLEYYHSDKNKTDTLYDIHHDIPKVHLSAYHRNITVGFASGISAGNDHQYYYVLVPASQSQEQNITWINNGRNAQVTLSNIESGNYRFMVKAQTYATGLESNVAILDITVADYFYKQRWFYVLLIAIVSFFFYLWQRRLKQENQRLENEVDKRTIELKNDKETIQLQAEELTKLDEAKTRFYNNISHELKTPLTLISAPLESLKDGEYIRDDRGHTLMNLIHKNVGLLTGRVEELLEINRLENNQVSLHLAPVNLTTFVENNVSIFLEESKRLNIDLIIPSAQKANDLMLDEKKLGKVVQNLISNALKYCPSGSKVIVDIQIKEKELFISVQDNGPGIPEKYHDLVFDKYFQVPHQQDHITGSGIGLSLVNEYVQLMKGRVRLISGEGLGSTFEIDIPVTFLEHIQEADFSEHDLPLIDIPQGKQHHILMVEDNEDLRVFLSIILSEYFQLSMASNGVEALDILSKNTSIDLILSDIMMPEMDGMSLLNAVKEDDRLRSLPFIILTAKQNEFSKISAFRAGVDDYVTKPFTKNELLLRIQRLLQTYDMRRLPLSKEEETEIVHDHHLYKRLESFVIKNITDPTFSVESIADELNMSERTLRRYLQREVGMSPKDFIIEVQMNLLRDLRASDKTISMKDLAMKVGYTDYKYMSKLFYQRFGHRL